MGCGSSSLKGDAPDNVGTAPQPVRKVQSNFKDVDYSTSPDPRKASMPGDRAPHEVDPPKSQKDGNDDDMAPVARKEEDNKLEPYKTITDSDQPAPLASSEQTPDMIR
jgi:hypothetical protein